MRPMQAQDAQVAGLKARSEFVTLDVKDGDGTWRNLGNLSGKNWLIDLSWGAADLDTPVTEAKASLWRNEFYLSLAAGNDTSRLNLNAAGAYSPLIDLNRDARIRGRVWPAGYTPADSDLETLWEGRIGSADDAASDQTSVAMEDLGARIRDVFIESERTYGSDAGVDLDAVVQSILTDNGTGVTLWAPVSASFNISPAYTQTQTSTLEACTTLAALKGDVVRYMWDPGTSAHRFKRFTPARTSTTSLYTFSTWQYVPSRFERALADIRNVIEVSYLDSATGTRLSVTVSDSASISKYGRRYGKVIEGDNSPINSSSEATTLANAVLSDLKEPKVSMTVEVPWFPWVEIGDLYTFTADGQIFTTDQMLAVVGYQHVYTKGVGKTTLQLRGSPAGAYAYYLRRVANTGIDTQARVEQVTPSYNGSAFSHRIEGNDRCATLWYQEPAVSSTWTLIGGSARTGYLTGTASTSAVRTFNVAGKNGAGELGPSREVTVSKYIPSTNDLKCLAQVTASDATTVTVTVTATNSGTVVYNGVTGSATKASGPNAGVSSASGTVWVFNRGAINAGSSMASFTASASGFVSDTDLVVIEEQGRDTVPLLMRASVTAATTSTITVRVAVADPYPPGTTTAGDITITYVATGTGTVTAASPQTILGTAVTADITTTGYVDFTVNRPSGVGSGRVTFTATRSGRTADADAVDVPSAAPQPPVAKLTRTAVGSSSVTYSMDGVLGTGGTAPLQVQLEDSTGSVVQAWTSAPYSRTFSMLPGANDVYRFAVRDANSTPLVSAYVPIVVPVLLDTGAVDTGGRVTRVRDTVAGTDVPGSTINTGVQLSIGTIASAGVLASGTRQTDGVTARVIAKGHIAGTARHLDPVSFPVTFQNAPLILLRGGLLSEPRSKWGATGSGSETNAFDATAPYGDDLVAVDAGPAGFTLRARLRQPQTATARTAEFTAPLTVSNAGDSIGAATLSNAPSADDSYIGRFGITLTCTTTPEQPSGSVSAVVALMSNDGVTGWQERAVKSFSISRTTTGSTTTTYSLQSVTATVSGLDSTDQLTLKLKNITITADSGSVTLEGYDNSPTSEGHGVTYNTSAGDKYASKTPDTNWVITWDAIETA